MGIPGFWELAASVSQTMPFMEFCTLIGLVENRRNIGTMIVGVDAGLWLTQCQTVFHKPHHAQMGRNPELRALFWKLTALNQVGVTAVFPFDGPNRPSIKRDKQVGSKPHWLVQEFTELIELFGFHHYTAPGEADAELAYLDRLGHIDAILTDDGDVALFGARRIIRKLNKNDRDEITVYTSAALQSTAGVGLTQGGILLIAIMSGGDYDTVGLAECGINIAHALARCGFGDSLLEASQKMDEKDLRQFLVGWREQIRTELATNSRGYLGRRYPALANKITDAFPNIQALYLYARPVTSWSENFVPPAIEGWKVRLPDLPALAKYCNQKFGWTALDMAGKFKKYIFPGLFIRRLTMPLNPTQQIRNHIIEGRIDEERPHLSTYLHILKVDDKGPYKKYGVKLATGALVEWTLSKIDAPTSAAGSPGATIVEWIPAILVDQCMPLMVNAFNRALSRPLVPVLPIAATPVVDFFDIPDDPEVRPVKRKWLGLVDLTDDNHDPDDEFIDLTEDSEDELNAESNVEVIDLT
ncbi:PIN domain-like protein [Mycena leptocephala]|nr:PIN domain-like protein [Mycena leptocephala]